MKGSIGTTTRIQNNIALGFNYPIIGLTAKGKLRLKWMDHYHKVKDASFTCRHFGISRKTFYKWLKRYRPTNPLTLNDQSKKPHKHRISEKIL